MLMKIKNGIIQVNELIEDVIGPEQRDRPQTYEDVLSATSCSRALHLGAGRDKEDWCMRLSDESEILAFDCDREGLSLNDTRVKIQGDATVLPFDDDTFDLVFAEQVFEHLTHPWTVLAELDRIVSPAGSIIILVPNPLHYYAIFADLTPFWFHDLWLRLNGNDMTETDTFPTEYEWGRLSQLRTTASEFDWDVVSLHSFPGPTGYTHFLPFHAGFVLLDRLLSRYQRFHVSYIIHYRNPDE